MTLTRVGAWYADVTLDANTLPTGAVTLASDDGTFALSGTVAFGDVYQSHVDIRIEAGGNGLDTILSARGYRNATLGVVLGDALRDAGETLDPTVPQSLLSASLPLWARRKSTLASVLGDIVRYACPIGTVWRVLSNGKVWLGTDTYGTPPVSVTGFETMDLAPSELHAVIATDTPDPGLIPGAVFDVAPGQDFPSTHVSQVEHFLETSRVRTSLYFADTQGNDRIWSPLAKTSAQTLSPVRYASLFTGLVVTFNTGDNTVDVAIDSPTATLTLGGAAQIPDLTHVPIRSFAPNVAVTPSVGARVLVAFEGSSPARPVVVAFENTSNLTSIALNAGTHGVGRVGDSVRVTIPAGSITSTNGTVTVTGPPVDLPLTGTITAGSTVVFA